MSSEDGSLEVCTVLVTIFVFTERRKKTKNSASFTWRICCHFEMKVCSHQNISTWSDQWINIWRIMQFWYHQIVECLGQILETFWNPRMKGSLTQGSWFLGVCQVAALPLIGSKAALPLLGSIFVCAGTLEDHEVAALLMLGSIFVAHDTFCMVHFSLNLGRDLPKNILKSDGWTEPLMELEAQKMLCGGHQSILGLACFDIFYFRIALLITLTTKVSSMDGQPSLSSSRAQEGSLCQMKENIANCHELHIPCVI